jgi:hypothetical protein
MAAARREGARQEHFLFEFFNKTKKQSKESEPTKRNTTFFSLSKIIHVGVCIVTSFASADFP